jgi:hypothetical protein
VRAIAKEIYNSKEKEGSMQYDITKRIEYQLIDADEQKSPVKRTFVPFVFNHLPLTVRTFAHVGTHKIDYPRPLPTAEISVATLYKCPAKDFSVFEVRYNIAPDEERTLRSLLEGYLDAVFIDRDKLVHLLDICHRVDEFRKENPDWREEGEEDEEEDIGDDADEYYTTGDQCVMREAHQACSASPSSPVNPL